VRRATPCQQVYRLSIFTRLCRVCCMMSRSCDMRTLLSDTDSQGSVSATLGLKSELHLYDFLVTQMSFKNCIVNACEELDVTVATARRSRHRI
jgi:cellulose biosynthesis protein BcsQ